MPKWADGAGVVHGMDGENGVNGAGREDGGVDGEGGEYALGGADGGGIPAGSSHFIFVIMFYLSINSIWGKSELVWHLKERRHSPTIPVQDAGANSKANMAQGQ